MARHNFDDLLTLAVVLASCIAAQAFSLPDSGTPAAGARELGLATAVLLANLAVLFRNVYSLFMRGTTAAMRAKLAAAVHRITPSRASRRKPEGSAAAAMAAMSPPSHLRPQSGITRSVFRPLRAPILADASEAETVSGGSSSSVAAAAADGLVEFAGVPLAAPTVAVGFILRDARGAERTSRVNVSTAAQTVRARRASQIPPRLLELPRTQGAKLTKLVPEPDASNVGIVPVLASASVAMPNAVDEDDTW